MGGSGSKTATTASATPNPSFPEPWRRIGDKGEELNYVQEFHPENARVRILLYGPVGAGKSSFVNSVSSAIQGRITKVASADAISGNSFTTTYRTHKIKKGNSSYPFVFTDTAGLEEDRGIFVGDIKLAMQGHVKDGYKFKPDSSLLEDDPSYNSSPALGDRVHVLVCVVPADNVLLMSDDVMKKMRDIRLAANDIGIPQLAIFTKIDEACPLVKKDIKNVYKSKFLKKKMEEFSTKLGIPMNCILPVKNYHEEIDIDGDLDVLILRALREMLDCGSDFIDNIHCH
ncbi:interferon-induced protein 44-like [Polymixia lowei]